MQKTVLKIRTYIHETRKCGQKCAYIKDCHTHIVDKINENKAIPANDGAKRRKHPEI